jgi:asparagine synthase (glutamine-hydrolysing)
MCGIWALIDKKNDIDITQYLADFWSIKHRGPDNSHFETFENVYIGFHRLSIMDTSFKSNQPYVIQEKDRTIVFICNGEIYNYIQLDKEYNLNVGTSDCLVIPKLYQKLGQDEFIKLFQNYEVKGEYAFIMFEFDHLKKLTKYIVGRDIVGIRPLYECSNNNIDYYCSEMKGMLNYKNNIKEFPPGNLKIVNCNLFGEDYNYINCKEYIQNIKTINCDNLMNIEGYLYREIIKKSVYNSIKRRLDADRPIAFLLSGGVDSSLVCAISAKIIGQPIRTFCCGLKGSTDMEMARKVAEHIGSNHTEVYFTEQDGLDSLEDVIYTTETWDTTTIRASVGQYLVCKYIAENTDCKVIMVGEGPDEVCSSYLFNYYAPDSESLDMCSKEYVDDLHKYDVRRVDRCCSRFGLEARVPFLDPEFISAYWSIPPESRMPKTHNMEKYWLRKSFESHNLLPEQVLWRRKEAFSDGVSGKNRSWYEIIQEYTNKKGMSENEYYDSIFNEYFGVDKRMVLDKYWQPKWDKDGKGINNYIDPSARVLDVYENNL